MRGWVERVDGENEGRIKRARRLAFHTATSETRVQPKKRSSQPPTHISWPIRKRASTSTG